MNETPTLVLERVARRYGDLTVLEEVDLAVKPGETVALLGPSGSGKSSLLHIAGLLERPSAGEIVIEGRAVTGLGDDEATALRRERIGFVYQFHHLLPEFDALRNVEIPMLMGGRTPRAAADRARALLGAMGLGERLEHQPAQLSGGEKQRVAIARALANEPAILLADEPTGNLDQETSARVFAALRAVIEERGLSAVVATHDRRLARQMDRTLAIKGRRLEAVPAREALD